MSYQPVNSDPPPAPSVVVAALPCIPVAVAAQLDPASPAPPVAQAHLPVAALGSLHLRLKTPSDVTWEISVAANCSVSSLKEQLAERSATPPVRQRIIFRGAILTDDARELASYGVESGCVLHFVPRPATAPSAAAVGGSGQQLPRAAVFAHSPEASLTAPRTMEMRRWTMRMRLLSSVMIFFYALGLIGTVATWVNPSSNDSSSDDDGGDAPRTAEQNEGSTKRMLSVVENIFGLTNAFAGLKAATTLDVRFSARFLRGLVLLSMFYAITTSIHIADLVKEYTSDNGADFDPSGEPDDKRHVTSGSLAMSLVTYLLAGTLVWAMCIHIALKFHRAVAQRVATTLRAAQVVAVPTAAAASVEIELA